MYAYIKGTLEHKDVDFMVIEANGIGYRIITPISALETSGPVGVQIKLYTHLHVREDDMSLYGFLTQEELDMFELLITVSGVGPKAAISVVSVVSPSRFGLSVITEDVKSLTRVPGIGAKTAQRIILELKDKIKKEQLAAAAGGEKERFLQGVENNKISEAVNALMVLGYNAMEASRAVASVYSEDMELETVIRNSLKGLVR